MAISKAELDFYRRQASDARAIGLDRRQAAEALSTFALNICPVTEVRCSLCGGYEWFGNFHDCTTKSSEPMG